MKNANDQNFFIFVGGLDNELYGKNVNGLNKEPLPCFFTEHFQKPLFRRNIINWIIIIITFYQTIIYYLFLLI